MDLSPALWSLITEWRDWASEPNINPSEQKETALNRVFACIIKKDPHLDLSHLSLTSLPTLPEWLITLDIHDNQLTTLPDNLPKTLTHLDAGKNQLTSLPERLPETLIEIRVDHNKLTRLPDNLPKNLSMLNADHNRLSSLLEHLPDRLSVFDVSDNQLTAIPHNLPPSLTILYINKNNLESLSDNLPNKLFYLDASDNPLTALPNKLPFKLEKLMVNNAFLTALPNTLPDELYHLSVSNNQITALPAKLPPKLQALTIDINQLSVLPNELPALLRMLNVASNKLTCLPEVLPEDLILLDVSHNQLKALPKNLPNNLLTLLANDNQLASLPFLPTELNIVKVYGNQLKNIPDELPPWLTVLDIGDNQLTAIEGTLPVELEVLNVSRNQLKKLPDHLPDSLVEIDASYNELVSLPDKLPVALNRLLIAGNQLTWLGRNLPRGITQLDVSHNQLREFPNHIPESLEILDVSYNKFISLPAHLPLSLQYIVAHHNQLNLLPNPLPLYLKILIVNNNELTQLPEVMPVFLQQVVVHNNQLTELPHFFEDLSYLDASYNQLTEFPAHFPSDVVTLILHNNQLRALPTHLFEELIFLDVHNNQIATLPEYLPLMLEYSDFSANPLDAIPTRFPLQFPQWHAAEHSIDISEEALGNWAADSNITVDEANGRAIAVERITSCIDNNSNSLDLSGLHLTRLPAHLPATISELRINNNQLSILPSHLPAKLKYLYAADNQLNALPGNLPNSLVYLDISNNQLTALPNSLPIMLKHLDGHNNLLTSLPTNLPNILITLNVSHNQLISLPNNLSNKLKKLDISSNQLTALPDSLPNQLGHLNVSDNQLEMLPVIFSAKLKYLNISHNKLSALSNHLPDVLRYLNVSDNQLMVLPPNLPAKLKYLNVSGNQLKELPAHFPDKLLFLDIDNNPLTRDHTAISIATIEKQTAQLPKFFSDTYELIPEWFKWLDQAPTTEAKARNTAVHRMIDCLCLQERSLDLSNLKLTSLPDHLPNNLIVLNVNDNQLTALPAELPSTIQKLYANNNQLTSLPVSLPERLILLDVNHNQLMALGNTLPTTLLGIDISHNQLLRLADHLPAGLLLLDADHNQLTFLPDSLPANLTHLIVSNNQLKTLTNYLPNSLIRIDVSNNQLTNLPDYIPDKLIKINFTGNQLKTKSIHLPINLSLASSSQNDASLTSVRKVSDWQLPAVSFQHEGESSRFDGQLIIQLENDPLVREAASQLVKKHPQISVLVQLDSQGNSFTVHGNIEHLQQQTRQRWQLVGHGRESLLDGEHVSLDWREAKPLAQQLKKLATDLALAVSPKHINLVGCSLADDKQQTSYVRQFAAALDETIRPYSVSAYSSKLIVNDEGRKRLMEAGNKTTLLFNHETNDWHIENTAAKTVDSRIKNGMEKSTLGDPLGLGSVSYKFLSFIKLAEQFQSTMIQFYHYHQLSLQKWLPLFTSFSKSKTQPGSYVLQLIHQETHLLKKLIINNKYIIDFINKYNEYLAIVSKAYHYNGKTLALRDNITDAEGVHGLNAAFLIKELIPWFANNHRFGVVDNELSETLSTAINIYAYLNLTQIAHGTVEDTLKLASLYHMAVNQGKQATKGLLGEVFHFHRATDFILNFSSIALDSIELANAQNDLQRAVFSAQLGVDSTNLAVAGVGIGAWMAGAQTTAAFTGALSVPLAGLGIGVSALAEAFGKVTHNVQIVGNYFADVDLAYKQGGYRQIKKKIADSDAVIIMEPIPGAVITELDLRQNKLTFDSQYLYRNDPTYTSGSGHSNYFLFWPNRSLNQDKTQAINIREGFGYQSSQLNFKPDDNILILPGTPITYLNYEYMILPFVTTRDDRGFDLLRKLEQDGRFDFDFYAFPGERAIYKIIPNYVSTPIKVILDDRDRELVIPALPIDFQRYMSYQLIGGEGEYRISLAKGVPITLVSNHANTRWVLDARYLKSGTNMQVSEEGDYLYIDNVIVTLPKNASQISVINKEGIFVFDEKSQQMHIIHMDAMRFNNNNSLDKYLKMLANIQDHPTPFVIIDHYQPDNAVGQVGRAYYETARSRMIYTNRPGEAEFLSQAILAKVDGDKAWFYRDTAIWQVEISSGKIMKQYQPFSFATESHDMIRSYTIQGNGQLLFVIEQGKNMRSVYIVEDTALKLVAINNDQRLLAILDEMKKPVYFIIEDHNSGQLLAERNKIPFLALDTRYELVSPTALVPSQVADTLYLSGYLDGQEKHYWIITKDKHVHKTISLNLPKVKPQTTDPLDPANELPESQLPSLTAMTEFILAANTTGDAPSYYFYNPQKHELYFQSDDGLSHNQAQLVASNIKSLFPINNKLFSLRDDGAFSLLDNQGKNVLLGVSQEWLRQHHDDAKLELDKLIKAMPYSTDYLMLHGLQDQAGDPIRAWYDSIAGRIVQAGSSVDANHDLVYLGLSEDRREALIYDNDEQQQYRFLQPAIVTLTPTESGLLISDIPADPLWATFA